MKKKNWLALTAAGIVLAVAIILNSPKVRAEWFVALYADSIEKSLEAGGGVPASDSVMLGYKHVNSWEGKHPMTEFLLMIRGDTYFGCYYSPEDIPLGFQNTPVKLIQDGHGYWVWKGEGDNRGATSRLREKWYYFEASF